MLFRSKKDSALKQIWPENSDKYSGGTTTTPSLLIKGVDETDSGTYRCDVVLVDDTHFTSQRNLCIPESKYEVTGRLSIGTFDFLTLE